MDRNDDCISSLSRKVATLILANTKSLKVLDNPYSQLKFTVFNDVFEYIVNNC